MVCSRVLALLSLGDDGDDDDDDGDFLVGDLAGDFFGVVVVVVVVFLGVVVVVVVVFFLSDDGDFFSLVGVDFLGLLGELVPLVEEELLLEDEVVSLF